MQKPWHLGKSLEVLLRKKKKKSFAETLKRSPTAARIGREFAGEWIYVRELGTPGQPSTEENGGSLGDARLLEDK